MSESKERFPRNIRENIPTAACGVNMEWARAQQHVYYIERGDKREVWSGGSN